MPRYDVPVSIKAPDGVIATHYARPVPRIGSRFGTTLSDGFERIASKPARKACAENRCVELGLFHFLTTSFGTLNQALARPQYISCAAFSVLASTTIDTWSSG